MKNRKVQSGSIVARTSIGLTAATMMLATSATVHGGDPPSCDLPSCENVDVGSFSPPQGWEFEPDRRPSVTIRCFNGNSNNPIGVMDPWYDDDVENPDGPPTDSDSNGVPDVFDWLLGELDQAYDLGFRRLILHLPAGTAGTFASSQYWTMPEWKRDGFDDHVRPWIIAKTVAGDPVSVGIYGGYSIADPCDLDMSQAHFPDPTDSDDMCTVWRNVNPWMKLGFKEYWFDAASPDWENMSTLQFSSDYAGRIQFGGEAIPSIGDLNCSSQDPSERIPHPDAIVAGAWDGIYRFVESRFDGENEIVDPETTELVVRLTNHAVPCQPLVDKRWTFGDAKRLYDHGWILRLHGPLTVNSSWQPYVDQPYTFDYSFMYSVEAANRIYNFGQLTAIIDFNNDGLIQVDGQETEDYDAFTDAWTANQGGHGEYLDGDVNGDGRVDGFDVLDFLDAIDQWNTSGTLVGVDLGPAPWIP